ncbi:MAG: hypothetical protein EPN33_10775 [Acidobacteria bacterium]|nr:MAG: hypothetical protein EPN33_10775 [Acidobacteriota bacterium]
MFDVIDSQSRHCRCGGRGLFGPLILIALGVIFLLDQLHVISAGYFFNYFWPAVFIIFGIELLSWRPRGMRLFWGVVAIVVGAGWIASNLGYWYLDLTNYWPVILIVVGISLLFRRPWSYRRHGRHYYRTRRRSGWAEDWSGAGDSGATGASAEPSPSGPAPGSTEASAPSGGDDSYIDGVAVLGGYQRRINSQQFRGGRLHAFFGGIQLDLHRAEIAGDAATLDITALFGGAEIRVPEHWIIEMHGQPFLGGYSDETQQDTPVSGAKRLIITGWAMFGGVVIKN